MTERAFITCRRFLSESSPCPHINEVEALSEVQDLLELDATIPTDLWDEALGVCRGCPKYLADYRA
jgi:hypothetical protein